MGSVDCQQRRIWAHFSAGNTFRLDLHYMSFNHAFKMLEINVSKRHKT